MSCQSASPTRADWRWLAAVIDGEGHISMVERQNGQLARRLAITNCHLPLLVRVAELAGGKIHVHRPVGKTKQTFQWYCYGTQMTQVIQHVLPYLIVKRQEAELAVALSRPQLVNNRRHLTRQDRVDRTTFLAAVDRARRQTWTAADVPLQFRPNARRDGGAQ